MKTTIYKEDAINAIPQTAIDVFENCKNCKLLSREEVVEILESLPSAQPEREWIPCSNPPKHHRDVLVRGTELIGYVTVHKVMQWDVDTWRPTNYAPSIRWEEWSEI